jgi:hypothetical protein
MFAVVRNDDGYPVLLGIFSNEDEAAAARDTAGHGHFVWKVSPKNLMKSIWP